MEWPKLTLLWSNQSNVSQMNSQRLQCRERMETFREAKTHLWSPCSLCIIVWAKELLSEHIFPLSLICIDNHPWTLISEGETVAGGGQLRSRTVFHWGRLAMKITVPAVAIQSSLPRSVNMGSSVNYVHASPFKPWQGGDRQWGNQVELSPCSVVVVRKKVETAGHTRV